MWIPIIIVVACMGIGLFYQYGTQDVDSPVEQLAEVILDSKGIDIDFSKDKKALSEQDKKKD